MRETDRDGGGGSNRGNSGKRDGMEELLTQQIQGNDLFRRCFIQFLCYFLLRRHPSANGNEPFHSICEMLLLNQRPSNDLSFFPLKSLKHSYILCKGRIKRKKTEAEQFPSFPINPISCEARGSSSTFYGCCGSIVMTQSALCIELNTFETKKRNTFNYSKPV